MLPLIPLLKSPYLHVALKVGGQQIQNYIGSKIDEQVLLRAQEKIEFEINSFLQALWRRSLFYNGLVALNVTGLLLIYFFENPYFSVFSACLALGLLIYSSVNMTSQFLKALSYIENFEPHLKSLIETEFEKAKTKNWKNQVYLFINSKSSSDYYNLILEEAIKVISQWLKKNRHVLYSRILFFIAASVLLSLSTREALSSFLLLF